MIVTDEHRKAAQDNQQTRKNKMSERQKLQLRSVKENEKANTITAERLVNALSAVTVTPDNLRRLIERCVSRWYTSPQIADIERRIYKLNWWISAGYLLGREIDSVGAINFFSEIIGDELAMSDATFKAVWNAESAKRLRASRISRELIPAEAREIVECPCKSGKKCIHFGNRKPASASGTSEFCSKNCAASDRARKKRLRIVANIQNVVLEGSETRINSGVSATT